MKNSKIMLTVAAFALAITGAFATSAAKKAHAASTIVPGYLHNGVECEFKAQCNESGQNLCTETPVGGAQIFGMDASGCATKLFRL